MDALSMAAPSGALRTGEGSAYSEQAVRPPLRLRTALKALLEAWDYAHDLTADPWEFALEIESLRRYELTNSDLRWMVGRGLVRHGIEVAPSGGKRAFQYSERLILTQQTCFVIAPAGIEAAVGGGSFRGAAKSESVSANGSGPRSVEAPDLPDTILSMGVEPVTPAQAMALPLPSWNRDRQELSVGDVLALRLTIPAPQAESLLTTFQELQWPEQIEAPLPMFLAPNVLQRAVATLNRRLRTRMLRFESCGPTSVRWAFAGGDPDESHR